MLNKHFPEISLEEGQLIRMEGNLKNKDKTVSSGHEFLSGLFLSLLVMTYEGHVSGNLVLVWKRVNWSEKSSISYSLAGIRRARL